MRIGIISDTHIPQQVDSLPQKLNEVFQGVDLILHAGDICEPSVLDKLERIAPVLAALGDDDPVTVYDARMKRSHRITIDGHRLWLTHSLPTLSHNDWYKGVSPLDPFTGTTDIIVFGHTHIPRIDYHKNIFLVGPGSATLPSYVPKPGTVAILTITNGKLEATIEQLK